MIEYAGFEIRGSLLKRTSEKMFFHLFADNGDEQLLYQVVIRRPDNVNFDEIGNEISSHIDKHNDLSRIIIHDAGIPVTLDNGIVIQYGQQIEKKNVEGLNRMTMIYQILSLELNDDIIKSCVI